MDRIGVIAETDHLVMIEVGDGRTGFEDRDARDLVKDFDWGIAVEVGVTGGEARGGTG